MNEIFRTGVSELFNRRHLVAIIGTLFISLHMVDELVRAEGLAPPFIPLIIFTIIYSFLPMIVRALAMLGMGGIFFILQIPGHLLPTLQRGPVGSDYTGVFPMIGGAILVGLGVQLLRKRPAP